MELNPEEENQPAELPEDFVSAWATVFLDLWEKEKKGELGLERKDEGSKAKGEERDGGR